MYDKNNKEVYKLETKEEIEISKDILLAKEAPKRLNKKNE